MLHDIPDAVQWTADRFWSQIQWVAEQGQQQKARLGAQKLALQNAYSAASHAGDQAKMDALYPLIHQNSQLRLRWNDLRDGFNTVVENARQMLADHGIHEPPTLAGLGQLETIIVASAWVVGLLAVIAIVYEIDQGIKAIDAAFQHLGPAGSTAISVAVLVAVGLGAWLLLGRPSFGKKASA